MEASGIKPSDNEQDRLFLLRSIVADSSMKPILLTHDKGNRLHEALVQTLSSFIIPN